MELLKYRIPPIYTPYTDVSRPNIKLKKNRSIN